MARRKSDDVIERQERVWELRTVHAMKPIDIARTMLAAGELPSKDLKAAHALVRSDLAEKRKTLSAEQVRALGDPAETAAFVARMEYVIRHAEREMERLESLSKSVTKMADGSEVVTVRKVDRAGVRQRWAEKYIQAARAIGVVYGVAVDARAAKAPQPEPPNRGGAKPQKPFAFNFSGKSLDTLIEERNGKGKVN